MTSKVNQAARLGEILVAAITLAFVPREKRVVAFRQTLEKLGSVFIKLGQMLALRPDIMPDTYCSELYKLLDQVPAFSEKEVEETLRRELKTDHNKVFLNFDYMPVASASFAQVHKARLKTGEMVAVKVQRPNIQKNIDSDMAILKKLAWITDLVLRPANKMVDIVEEFEDWTKDELNYKLEAANIERFNKLEEIVNDKIRAPAVYEKYSTSKVIVMEYIDGPSLAKIIQARSGKKPPGFDGKEVVNQLLRNTLEMVHVHGFFHADPHPANIIFTKNGELVFIDFGIVGTLTQKERVLILRYLRSMLTGNSDVALDALVSLCGENGSNNIAEVRKGYRLISNKLAGTFEAKTYLEQQKLSGPILAEALNLLQKNGFKVPVGVVRYFKAFETIEGLIFALYPELQVKNMVKEFRRVSIINIFDSLPSSLEEKGLDSIMLKLISSIEDSLLLN